MVVERTLSIIKPDAVAKGAIGAILAKLEREGLRPIAIKMIQLSELQAQGFYAIHKDRPFYGSLVKFMSSGPIVVSVLEGEDAIACNRRLMGKTDPAQAEPGTIRAEWGTDIERNAVHGSDAPATARVEIAYFFDATEIQGPVEALP
jgi:nucleoside-diphosphate kinase